MNEKALWKFFKQLDRAYFIDNASKSFADLDAPLAIGFGQTISQPSLVFEMTLLLAPNRRCKVLEIGTGSGYQTALLAEFSGRVFTIERIRELAEAAKKRLDGLGYDKIEYKTGDGSEGWIEHAPYDRIMVTAAAEKVPDELIEQLKAGGRMIIPAGARHAQDLLLITRDQSGKVHSETVNKVVFVELVGKYGWSGTTSPP